MKRVDGQWACAVKGCDFKGGKKAVKEHMDTHRV